MATKIRCHYEVLGLERDAADADIKKAYKKLALKYHPDKNPDNVEEATLQFRIVQQGYEVLIDPQERAWYDKHREAILRGGMGAGDKYNDDSLDLFQFFNSTCYSGFGDDEKGFYTVYRDAFESLAQEDYVFMPDMEEDEEFPKFGDSSSDYEEIVGPFYGFWSSFCTNKSYVWAEKYDTREAPDRRCRRAMEAENKKLRDAAKKERNEEIRNLVMYAKKRDKRVQAEKKRIEERNKEIERKAKEKREEELRERQRKMENYKEAEWSAMSELEKDMQQLEAHLGEHFGDEDDGSDTCADAGSLAVVEEEEEIYIDENYCVACNKAFKNEKSFINHEKSKKHKEMVAILAEEMRLEEEEAENNEEESTEELENEEALEDAPEEDIDKDIIDESQEKKPDNTIILSDEGEDLDEILSLEEDDVAQIVTKKNKKKKKQKNKFELTDADIVAEQLKETSVTEESAGQKTKSKKARRRAKEAAKESKQSEDEEIPCNSTSEEKTKLNETINVHEETTQESEGQRKKPDENASEGSVERAETSCESESVDKVEMNGEKTNEENIKETNLETNKQSNENKNRKQKDTEKCQKCKKGFPSKTKLFDHLKKTGHAVPLAATTVTLPAAEEERGKKGKKKNKR